MQKTNLPIESLFPRLMRTAAYKTGNDQDAADLVSEAVLAALRAEAKGTVIENAEAYLMQTMENIFHARLRQKYGTIVMSIDDESLYMLASDEKSAEETLISREEAEELRREIAFLAKKYREAIVRFYFKGESVESIADALSLPQGTVKSRLDTGRKTLRKGLTMKNFDTPSYEPQTMNIGICGSPGWDSSPFCYQRDLLMQNILICAYKKPLTAVEIAKTLGVAACYVESALDKLVQAELMQVSEGGKYSTRFIMHFPEDAETRFEAQKAFVNMHRSKVDGVLKEAFEALLKEPYLANEPDTVKRSALSFFGLEVFRGVILETEKQIYQEKPTTSNTKRPHNGSWHAMGHVHPENKDIERQAYYISGKYQRKSTINGKQYTLSDYSSHLGQTHETYQFNPNIRLEKLLYDIAQKNGENLETIDLDVIPNLIEIDILEKTEDGLRLAIPFFKEEDEKAFLVLLGQTTKRILAVIGKELEAHLRANKIDPPAHVWDYLEYMRYFPARDAMEMLFLANDEIYPISMRKEDGKFHAPAMILCEK